MCQGFFFLSLTFYSPRFCCSSINNYKSQRNICQALFC
nr:MAG TPA: hypothetical protein [Caudoviricetes sp.]